MVSWQKYKVALVVWSTVLNLNAKSDNWVRQEKNLTNKALFISFSYISSFHLFSLPFWVGPRSWNQLLAKGLAVELGLWNFIFSPKSPSVCHPSARAVLSAALPVDSLALQGLLWMFCQKCLSLYKTWITECVVNILLNDHLFKTKNGLAISSSPRNLFHAIFNKDRGLYSPGWMHKLKGHWTFFARWTSP